MSKETFYFSHDYNARHDRKLVKVKQKHRMAGIGIFWCLAEMLYEENGKILLSDIPTISEELKEKESVVISIINDFDLFKNDGINFWSESVKARLDKRFEKSQKAKESADARWRNANALPPHTDSNAIKKRKVKKKKGKGGEAANAAPIPPIHEDVPEAAPVYTTDEVERFDRFVTWIKVNAEPVLKMEEPITIDQFLKLQENYSSPADKARVLKKVAAMGNKPELTTKYISAYRTLINWLSMDDDNSGGRATVITMPSGGPSVREAADAEALKKFYAGK